jgi:hypothetical protein
MLMPSHRKRKKRGRTKAESVRLWLVALAAVVSALAALLAVLMG